MAHGRLDNKSFGIIQEDSTARQGERIVSRESEGFCRSRCGRIIYDHPQNETGKINVCVFILLIIIIIILHKRIQLLKFPSIGGGGN